MPSGKNAVPELGADNAEVAYEQWIGQRDPGDVGSRAGFTAGWAAGQAVAGPLEAENTVVKARLKAAESVCLLVGWQGSRVESDTEKAIDWLWSEWAQIVGAEFTEPDAHPELTGEAVAALARVRDGIIAQMMAPHVGKTETITEGEA